MLAGLAVAESADKDCVLYAVHGACVAPGSPRAMWGFFGRRQQFRGLAKAKEGSIINRSMDSVLYIVPCFTDCVVYIVPSRTA